MTTLDNGINWSPRLAIYGDMGSTNARSLPRLTNETDSGNLDAILHVGKTTNQEYLIQPYFIITGDFAYDFATVNNNVNFVYCHKS